MRFKSLRTSLTNHPLIDDTAKILILLNMTAFKQKYFLPNNRKNVSL